MKTVASFVLTSLKASTYENVRLGLSLVAALLDNCFDQPAAQELYRNGFYLYCTRYKRRLTRDELKCFECGMRGFDRVFDVAG